MSGVLASSVDGRSFTTSAGEGAPTGTLVRLETTDGAWLALVEAVSPDGAEVGRVLGVLDGDGGLDQRSDAPFRNAHVRPADAASVDALHRAAQATLDIGTMLASPGPAKLIGTRFNRHTFWCGQSGSGKTYALGVLLERLILQTDLRVAIFDPNADFVQLGRTLPGVAEDDARRLAERDVRVLRSDLTRTEGADKLRLRFRSMPRAAQAAVLQLDPIRDQAEYNAFIRTLAQLGSIDLGPLMENLRAGTEADRRLAHRVENLGLAEWEVWARDLPSAADIVTGSQGVTVMDLGGFGDPLEPVSLALEVVEELWAQRDRRAPTLLVIDEAHNLCRADPGNPVAELLLDRLIQIAAEGRKYGLWLLLSSQRPSKIHPQILSQCDNLMLMRMNSPDDIVELGRTFGFAPHQMLRASTGFVQGEALLAGGFAPVPMLVQMRTRITAQGGSDVAVPLVSTPD